MFDEIEYRYILPLESNKEIDELGIELEKIRFQTKSLDSALDIYTINEKGRLIQKKVKYKWVDDDNAFLKGYLDEESSEMVDTNFHGELPFYCYESIDKEDKEISLTIDYVAKFTNGTLDSVKIKSYNIRDTTESRENIRKMLEESDRLKKIWYNKYFFQTKKYNKLIRRPVLAIFRNISSFFNSIYYWVSRHI
jgi:hypothetical protein